MFSQCWAKLPSDRPTFGALKEFLRHTFPPVMRAIQSQDEDGKLEMKPGDSIIIVDGR